MHATVFLMCLFGFPETKWHRVHPAGRQENESGKAATSTREKAEVVDTVHSQHMGSPDTAHSPTAQMDPYLGKGAPGKQQFKLFQSNKHPLKSILIDLWIPWKLFAFPIVEFASFIVSWSASCYLTINLTQSQALEPPPYGFSPLSVGLSNFASLIGAFIGLLTAGPLSDWISMKLTKRNGGIREPEMRLPTMIPYVLLMILGNFVVAFGYDQSWNWRVSTWTFSRSRSLLNRNHQAILIVGWGCAGIQVAALPAIASTYAVDSYKPVAGSIFVSITVNKNLWGYGFSKFITPWVLKDGYVPPVMTNMSLMTLWCLFGIFFWFVGKKLRILTKNSKVHQM